MNKIKKIRALVAGLGTHDHEKAVQLTAAVLRDAGMEVIYTGMAKGVNRLVPTVIQEDVNVISLSLFSMSHLKTLEKMMASLKNEKVDNVLFIATGVIPDKDIPVLYQLGVDMVFKLDMVKEMIKYIEEKV